MFKKRKLLPVWRGLTTAFAALMILFTLGTGIADANRVYVDQALGTKSTKVVTEVREGEDLYTYKTQYETSDELIDADKDLGERMAAEGTVLLKNKSGTLPLKKSSDKNVTLLGDGAYYSVLGGNMGSSASNNAGINPDYAQVTFYSAMNALDGISINPAPKASYDANAKGAGFSGNKHGVNGPNGGGRFGGVPSEVGNFDLGGLSASDLATDGVTNLGTYNDVAFVVFSRTSSEGTDHIPFKTDGSSVMPEGETANTPLAITDAELSIINDLAKDAKKVVVLLNSSHALDIKRVVDNENVDAILWCGTPGVWGMKGVVDVLYGDKSPSGRLPDTYAVDSTKSPSMMNYGLYRWTNPEAIGTDTITIDSYRGLSYEVEAEGIYTGYRYYETRYADTVMNKGNAKNSVGASGTATEWNYDNEVVYTFGYGLSYSTFTQTLDSVTVDKANKVIKASVTVKNTGGVKAKDVVQLYASTPYGEYEIKNKVEKAAVTLLDFGKTEEINPGEEDTVELEIPMKYLASYDYKGAKTYILSEGQYYFAIGKDAHEANKNILTKRGFSAGGDATKVYDGYKERSLDKTTFSVSDSGVMITNQLDDMDLNYYMEDKVTYLSRNDWQATWPKSYAGIAANDEIIYQLRNRLYDIATDEELVDKWGEDRGEENLTLGALKDAAWDDERWYYLLNQITLEEAVTWIAMGGSKTDVLESIQNPEAVQSDGPNGFNNNGNTLGSSSQTVNPNYKEDDPNKGYWFGTMANAPLVAATFNKELIFEFGEHVGEQSIWTGSPIIWAGGANIHRNPYCGRTNEYYSEDPMLSNIALREFCAGGKTKGCILSPKHFAFNDMDTGRVGLSCFMNEQQAREGELRAFQGGFEEAGCLGVMTAFNRTGATGVNAHTGLMKNILRGEWDFKGIATTDMLNNPEYFTLAECIYNGITMIAGTADHINGGKSEAWKYSSADNIKNDARLCNQLRQNMKYQCYAYANSNLMNGVNETSYVVKLSTWWESLLISLSVVFGVLAAAGTAMVVLTSIKSKQA